jgi:hypothetical protein
MPIAAANPTANAISAFVVELGRRRGVPRIALPCGADPSSVGGAFFRRRAFGSTLVFRQAIGSRVRWRKQILHGNLQSRRVEAELALLEDSRLDHGAEPALVMDRNAVRHRE